MGAAQALEPTLIAVAARCLRLRAESIDPEAPLVRYGLDSLTSVELGMAVSEATGVELPEELLFDGPSIRDLAMHVFDRSSRCDADAERLACMVSDAMLPVGIVPARPSAASSGPIVLTGATGLLGAHLLHELLRSSDRELVCLVRAEDDAHARRRLEESMARRALGGLDDRMHVWRGDFGQPHLGLARSSYERLARTASAIVHCAAQVDWTAAYDRLRDANVKATEGLLRFACAEAAKPLHFVSSLAAGYSTDTPSELTEDGSGDPAGLHLGYGQSKWVAEQLVAAAHRRALPTTIYRPSLLVGHSVSALGNDDDLFARMVRGCIALGCAPDLDWDIDACPVDFAASAIAANVLARDEAIPVVHLRNPKPASWRAAVLWMNLRGYPVRLVPFAEWIARVRADVTFTQHPLYALRGFLLNRPPGAGGLHLPQLYAKPHVRGLSSVKSDAALAARGLDCPRLSARLLERYFDNWVERGLLPPSVRALPRRQRRGGIDWNQSLESLLRSHFSDPRLRVERSLGHDFGAAHSIIGELGSWRAGSEVAMHARTVRLVRGDGRASTLEVVLKTKLPDALVLDVTHEIATHCDPALGAAFSGYRAMSEFVGAARREAQLYREASGALQSHMPVFFGTIASPHGTTLVLERVQAVRGPEGNATEGSGSDPAVAAALRGLARIHGQFLDRSDWLAANTVMPAVRGAASAGALAWWSANAAHARSWLADWLGAPACTLQQSLVRRYPDIVAAQAREPATLIHRDFNPRNTVIRHTPLGLRLCAFDWELAAYGLPQRDVVEYLCFALGPDASSGAIARYVELARVELERSSGRDFASPYWQRGVRLALADFAVTRLPLYFIVHRFRPQDFLERVARTWWRLVSLLGAAD